MKRLISLGVIIISTTLLLVACGDKTIKGDGNIVTQSRTISSSLDEIKASGNLNLVVDANASRSISVTTDKNLQQYIITSISGDTLRVNVKEGFELASTKPVVVKISVPKLRDISTEGSVHMKVTGLSNQSFDLTSSGSSAIQVSGRSDKVSISAKGASQIDAQELEAEQVDMDVSGTAKAAIYATKKLVVKISGAGQVVYYGSPPIINQAVFGSGKISKGK